MTGGKKRESSGRCEQPPVNDATKSTTLHTTQKSELIQLINSIVQNANYQELEMIYGFVSHLIE